jgi:hypothetical protein
VDAATAQTTPSNSIAPIAVPTAPAGTSSRRISWKGSCSVGEHTVAAILLSILLVPIVWDKAVLPLWWKLKGTDDDDHG